MVRLDRWPVRAAGPVSVPHRGRGQAGVGRADYFARAAGKSAMRVAARKRGRPALTQQPSSPFLSSGGRWSPDRTLTPLNRINVNGRIRAREVRVILASSKEVVGIMKTSDALRKANQLGLDLVEIAPNATPPVCQIVDFGKYRYEQSKLEKERHHHAARVKELKFRVNIDPHDYFTKIRRGEEFLEKGAKLKVQLQFKGREMAHQELGDQLMVKIQDDLATMSQVEMPPRKAGRSINMVLSPLPANKRKRRFKPLTEEEIAAAEAREAAEHAHAAEAATENAAG